jgi:acetyl-CoA carboxylase biotin carboxyl carrier protein
MNLEQIQELIAVMRKNRIKEIDLDQDGAKLRIVACEAETKSKPEPAPAAPAQPAPYPFPMPYFAQPQPSFGMPAAVSASPVSACAAPGAEAATPVVPALTPLPPVSAEEPVLTGTEIKSPMVGTFYRAPAPSAPAYVEVGSMVSEETVLCIVEAMKLMNEIKAETRGKILKVLVKNGEPVEYGQPLFLIEPF